MVGWHRGPAGPGGRALGPAHCPCDGHGQAVGQSPLDAPTLPLVPPPGPPHVLGMGAVNRLGPPLRSQHVAGRCALEGGTRGAGRGSGAPCASPREGPVEIWAGGSGRGAGPLYERPQGRSRGRRARLAVVTALAVTWGGRRRATCTRPQPPAPGPTPKPAVPCPAPWRPWVTLDKRWEEARTAGTPPSSGSSETPRRPV